MDNKFLYIDPFSPNGHINFNKIYVSALSGLNLSIDFIFKEDYAKNLNLPINPIFEIPKNYYYESGKLGNRILYYKIFKFLKKKINFQSYDYVFFSSYEEISLFTSRIKGNLFLISHDNVRGFLSPVKRFFLKRLAKNSTFLVFEDYMKDLILKTGIEKVKVLPHSYLQGDIKKNPTKKDHCEYQIFLPSSANNVDFEFINTIINSNEIKDILVKKNIVLTFKSKSIKSQHRNISIINYRLNDEEYRRLFLQSDIILIPYSNFLYRTSGVLFECIANEKKAFIKNLKAFECYKNMSSSLYYFSSIEDFKILLKKIDKIVHASPDFEELKSLYGPEILRLRLEEIIN